MKHPINNPIPRLPNELHPAVCHNYMSGWSADSHRLISNHRLFCLQLATPCLGPTEYRNDYYYLN